MNWVQENLVWLKGIQFCFFFQIMHGFYLPHLSSKRSQMQKAHFVLEGKGDSDPWQKGFLWNRKEKWLVWKGAYDNSGFEETRWLFTPQSQLKGQGKLMLATWAQHLTTATRPPPGSSGQVHVALGRVGQLTWQPPCRIWWAWDTPWVPGPAHLSRLSTSELDALCAASPTVQVRNPPHKGHSMGAVYGRRHCDTESIRVKAASLPSFFCLVPLSSN